MARDYKRQGSKRRRPARRDEAAAGWVWGLAGLAVGLAVAYGVHVYHANQAPGARPSPATTVPAVRAPLAEQEDDVDLVEESPFDFYEILPDFTVEVTDAPEPEAGSAPAAAPAAVPAAGGYWLQAGSFRQHEDADRRRAQLALLGFSSVIQRVAVDDQTWHRVRVGPYEDASELSLAQSQLAGNDIKTLRVKVQE
jgi:cell division protein FtsN